MTKWVALSTTMWLKKISLEVRVTLKHTGKDTRNLPNFLKIRIFTKKKPKNPHIKKKEKKQQQTPPKKSRKKKRKKNINFA